MKTQAVAFGVAMVFCSAIVVLADGQQPADTGGPQPADVQLIGYGIVLADGPNEVVLQALCKEYCCFHALQYDDGVAVAKRTDAERRRCAGVWPIAGCRYISLWPSFDSC